MELHDYTTCSGLQQPPVIWFLGQSFIHNLLSVCLESKVKDDICTGVHVVSQPAVLAGS